MEISTYRGTNHRPSGKWGDWNWFSNLFGAKAGENVAGIKVWAFETANESIICGPL